MFVQRVLWPPRNHNTKKKGQCGHTKERVVPLTHAVCEHVFRKYNAHGVARHDVDAPPNRPPVRMCTVIQDRCTGQNHCHATNVVRYTRTVTQSQGGTTNCSRSDSKNGPILAPATSAVRLSQHPKPVVYLVCVSHLFNVAKKKSSSTCIRAFSSSASRRSLFDHHCLAVYEK